ncbi:dehydrogenase/reductase SDR family member 4-like [Gastrophryne carolinensis]
MQSAKEVQTRKFQGKVALVTGSTDGIGLAIARRLAQDGAQVLISSRKQENVDRTVKELKAEGLDVEGTVCDICLSKDREGLVNTAVQTFGGIDILISNAAIDPDIWKTLDCTEELWDELLNSNVKAPFFLTKLVVPKMQERGGGSIVFISSASVYAPYSGAGPYDVGKIALLGLMKSLAPELSPLNIRVNSIAPGFIRTSSSAYIWKDESLLDEALNEMRISSYCLADDRPRKLPVYRDGHCFQWEVVVHRLRPPAGTGKRISQLYKSGLLTINNLGVVVKMGEPEECAGLASFLCSSDASYITGENIVVGGGCPTRL